MTLILIELKNYAAALKKISILRIHIVKLDKEGLPKRKDRTKAISLSGNAT